MNFADQLERIVKSRIEKDSLTLPTLAAVAFKAIELTRTADFNMQAATSLIEKDPVLAVQVLRLSKTATVATHQPCNTISQAIARLGAKNLRGVLVEISSRRALESRDSKVMEAVKTLWEHSRAVAQLAQRVAVVSGASDPDTAYLAGLLHDLGKPVVATILLEAESQIAQRNPKLWIDFATWIDVVQRCHRPIGLDLARKWQLPDEIQKAIEECGDYDPANRLSTGNAVRFANAVVKQQGLYTGSVSAQDNDALIMIGRSLLGIDDDTLTRLSSDLKEIAREAA
ncbi:MAG: HDOD domain-containing protein [Polyangia bacterium]